MVERQYWVINKRASEGSKPAKRCLVSKSLCLLSVSFPKNRLTLSKI